MKDEPLSNETTGAALPLPTCIIVYTDGSCQPNPGRGGYAAILCRYRDGREIKRAHIYGCKQQTTNNEMEMRAAVEALKLIRKGEKMPAFIRSDSKYLIDGKNEWLPGWITKGWRKADGKEPENIAFWREIVELCDGLDVTFEWVRGHSDDPMNAEADQLAAKGRAQRKPRVIEVMEGELA